jgi:hypothetical protein
MARGGGAVPPRIVHVAKRDASELYPSGEQEDQENQHQQTAEAKAVVHGLTPFESRRGARPVPGVLAFLH